MLGSSQQRKVVSHGASPRLSLRLGDRLYTFVQVRFLVAGAIIGGAYFARHVVGIEDLNVPALTLLALVLTLCNFVSYALVRPYHDNPEKAQSARRFLIGLLHVNITADFLFLTVALWLVGGPQSPFRAFFIFHVIIASVLLSSRATYMYAAFGYGLFASMTLATWYGCIPIHSPAGAVPEGSASLDGRYVLTVLTVQAILFASTAFLLSYLMRLLQTREAQLMRSNRELDRLSRQRRDFLRIAMHNLRSPIGAASMTLTNLAKGYGGDLNEQQRHWLERALHRLAELGAFLNDLQHLAAVESASLEGQATTIPVSELLEELVLQNQDLAEQKGHTLTLDVEPNVLPVAGVRRLVREAIANYITNAIKYSPEPASIRVRACNLKSAVRIEVHDQGIGIPEKEQPRLFTEFARVHLTNPAVADVAGSGLGLFLVKQIVEAHNGNYGFESVPGEGSTFYMEFPAALCEVPR